MRLGEREMSEMLADHQRVMLVRYLESLGITGEKAFISAHSLESLFAVWISE